MEEILRKLTELTAQVTSMQVDIATLKADRENNLPRPDSPVSFVTNKDVNGTEEKIKCKEAMRFIREFDGNGAVTFFIKQIERTRALVDNEKNLLRLIVAEKLKGRAAKELEPLDVSTYSSLYTSLKILFGATAPMEVHVNNRLRCIQGQTESVTSYTNRFISIQEKIQTDIFNNPEKSYEENEIRANYEKDQGLRIFINGLKNEYALEVRALRPKTIREAALLAQAAESNLFARKQSEQLSKTVVSRLNTNPRNVNTNNNYRHMESKPRELQQRVRVQCTFCRKFGHSESNCYNKDPSKRRNFQLRHDDRESPPARARLMETENNESEFYRCRDQSTINTTELSLPTLESQERNTHF